MTDIIALIDKYSEAVDIIEGLKTEKLKLLECVIPADVQVTISEIDEEFADKIKPFEEAMKDLRTLIEKEIVAYGATVHGNRHMAIYVKGRVSWNDEFLRGVAIKMPSILTARKEGAPSVQIREIKGSGEE